MLLKLALQLNQPTIAKLQILISCAKKKCIHYFHMFSPRPRLDVIFPGDSCTDEGLPSPCFTLLDAFGHSFHIDLEAVKSKSKRVAVDPIDSDQ